MQWLTGTPNFNFVKYRRVAMVTSSLLSLLAIASVIYPGLNYGVDFTGGVIVEVGYARPADLDAIRSGLADAGFESAQVQNFGSSAEVLIRLPPLESTEGADNATANAAAVTAVQDRVLDVLRAQDPDVTVRGIAPLSVRKSAQICSRTRALRCCSR